MNMDIALSARVRLARNLRDMPFPNRMDSKQRAALITRVHDAMDTGFMLIRMSELPMRERRVLVERHLISPDLARIDEAAALINKEETISILIGEEDHLRIQCIQPGLALTEADEISAELDKKLGLRLPYAFDAKLGYLTACPTNVGSGMRASVMLHLPVLSMLGQSDVLISAISKLGGAVRGIYGEGSGAPGHIYQVSNQLTLGMPEEDIISNLGEMVRIVIARERGVREPFYRNNRTDVEDRVYRSLGALRYARRLASAEAMERLSDLKLGASVGLLPPETHKLCNRLFTDIQSASVEQRAGRELIKPRREEERAKYIRREITQIEAMCQKNDERGETQ